MNTATAWTTVSDIRCDCSIIDEHGNEMFAERCCGMCVDEDYQYFVEATAEFFTGGQSWNVKNFPESDGTTKNTILQSKNAREFCRNFFGNMRHYHCDVTVFDNHLTMNIKHGDYAGICTVTKR